MKKVLVVVDMQEDFIYGSLGSESARAIVPNVIKKIEEYDALNYPVLFTRDSHYAEDYLTTLEGTLLPVPHCILGTSGWEIPSDILGNHEDICNKFTFGLIDLAREIERLIPEGETLEEVEFVGLCTNICVVSNCILLRAFFPNLPITVDASCCAGTSPTAHEAALITMESCQIKVINKTWEA